MINKCHEKGKPVVIVGQMLESMVDSLVPSTSEINDVSNLVSPFSSPPDLSDDVGARLLR